MVGIEVKAKALEVVQLLGQSHASQQSNFPLFFETYAKLTAQGCIFPLTQAQHSAPNIQQDPVDKLKQDLKVVQAKLRSADATYFGAKYSENCQEILEFFEQCRQRLELLVQVGSWGGLSDDMLVECLQANDQVCSALKRLKDPTTAKSTSSRTLTSFAAPPVLAKPPKVPDEDSLVRNNSDTLQQHPKAEATSKLKLVRRVSTKNRTLLPTSVARDEDSESDEHANLLNASEDSWNSDEEQRLLG